MCSSLPWEAVAVGPKASCSSSSPSKAVTMGPKALRWHWSPMHHGEQDWDSFLLPVLILEPDWDSFVVPVVISELEWDSFRVPEWECFLEPDWDLFGLPVNLRARSRELVYRRIVSQRPIVCTACSNRSMCVRRVRVPLLRRLQGSRGRVFPS